MRHQTQNARGGALRDRRRRQGARAGECTGAGCRLQECSSIHELHTLRVTRRPVARRQAALPTPQKKGSGPLTTPLTFLRHA